MVWCDGDSKSEKDGSTGKASPSDGTQLLEAYRQKDGDAALHGESQYEAGRIVGEEVL